MKIKDLVDKLTSYNLFNYLFPGFLFVIILKETTGFISATLEINITLLLIMYFCGLVISRIGSLIIEEILKFFIILGEIDTKILLKKFRGNIKLEIIHEAMNMYRTLASMFFTLLIISLADSIIYHTDLAITLELAFLESLLFILFTFSYCKQRKKVLQCLPDFEMIAKDLFSLKRKENKKDNL